jgi:hypothetical protein
MILLVATMSLGSAAILLRLAASIRQRHVPMIFYNECQQQQHPAPCRSEPAENRLNVGKCGAATFLGQCLSCFYITLWLLRCVLLTVTVASLLIRLRFLIDIESVGTAFGQLIHDRITNRNDTTPIGWDADRLITASAHFRQHRWNEWKDACDQYTEDITNVIIDQVHEFVSYVIC